jgi:hypothetical protein
LVEGEMRAFVVGISKLGTFVSGACCLRWIGVAIVKQPPLDADDRVRGA